MYVLFSSSRAIEVHSIYLIRTFSIITGNRSAFHLPYKNFFTHHGQSKCIPFTLFELICLFMGNRSASHLPYKSFFTHHGQWSDYLLESYSHYDRTVRYIFYLVTDNQIIIKSRRDASTACCGHNNYIFLTLNLNQ